MTKKEKQSAADEKYYQANSEGRKEYSKAYYQANREQRLEYYKQYRQSNKQQRAKRVRDRKASDPAFRFLENLRARHRAVLCGKASTTAGLGCTAEQLKGHLESQFANGMSWDNYGHGFGKWTMDHIKPLDSHHKTEAGDWDTTSEYNKQLIHYTNLQPMWYLDNIKKSNKI